MQKEHKMSPESYKKLKEEYDYLKNVREMEVAEQIKEARKFGDLSENSEYDEAKNEQAKVYARKKELEIIIANAVVIDTVSSVVVQDLDTGDKETYTLVGSQDANPIEGKISFESPFGRSLTDKNVGDEFTLDVPAGKLRYKVLDIL